jgi:PAS domain S-box-containing protein
MDTQAASRADAATDPLAIVRALEHLPAPTHVVAVDDAHTFPFVAVNHAMEVLFRAPRDTVIGTPLGAFGGDGEAIRAALEAHRLVAETGRPYEYTILDDRPPSHVFIHCTLTPLRDSIGRVTHILGVDSEVPADIRSQLEQEAELQRVRAQTELEARARADELVADASTRLLSAPTAGIDDAVRLVLSQFCELLGAEHAALWQAEPSEGRFRRAYAWPHSAVGDAVEDGPAVVTAGDMPWAADQTRHGDDPMFLADTDALPPEAAAEQALLQGLGVRSLVSVPIHQDDRLLGVVVLAWIRSAADSTTLASIPALRILGNSLLAALERARFEDALRRSYRAATMVAKIARDLVASATPAEVDATLARGLERAARLVGGQAAGLVTIGADGLTYTRTHVWDSDPQRGERWLQLSDVEADATIRGRLDQQDVLLFTGQDGFSELPPALRDRFIAFGVLGVGYLALRSGGQLLGWGTVAWFEGEPRLDPEIAQSTLDVLGEIYLLALERTEASENLRESARLLEWAQAAAHIGSWSFHPDTDQMTWSDELYRILGFEPRSVPATPEVFDEVVPPPEGGGIRKIGRVADLDDRYRGLRRAIQPGDEERMVLCDVQVERGDDGHVLDVLGTVQDVTDAARAQQAVHDSEARFRALVLESGELIQLLDADGTVLYASPAVERDLGWDVVGTGLTDRRFVDAIHPADRAAIGRAFAEALDRPRVPLGIAYRVRDRDGRWRNRETMVTNFLDDPRVKAVVINARDVTERRELEEQLRESQKMEAVGQLAGGIAHDFNNLLTAITGYATLLMDDAPEGTSTRADLMQIQRAADRAAALVEKLMQFSRRQPTNPVVLDVMDVIESLGGLLERVIGEDIELVMVLAPFTGLVRIDRTHLEQVVMNFVVNARDAMPRGGRLTIESRGVVIDADVSERLGLSAGPHLRLDVSDTGTGMDESTAARIFEPFFTTKDVGKGTGLGLSTVYGIVTQAGGRVSVVSQVGEGTTFTVLLPVVDTGGPPVPRARSEQPPRLKPVARRP